MIRQHQIDPDVSKTGKRILEPTFFIEFELAGGGKVYVQEPERLFRKPAAQAGFGVREGGAVNMVRRQHSRLPSGPMKPERDNLGRAG